MAEFARASVMSPARGKLSTRRKLVGAAKRTPIHSRLRKRQVKLLCLLLFFLLVIHLLWRYNPSFQGSDSRKLTPRRDRLHEPYLSTRTKAVERVEANVARAGTNVPPWAWGLAVYVSLGKRVWLLLRVAA
jgi:hypothetical protein